MRKLRKEINILELQRQSQHCDWLSCRLKCTLFHTHRFHVDIATPHISLAGHTLSTHTLHLHKKHPQNRALEIRSTNYINQSFKKLGIQVKIWGRLFTCGKTWIVKRSACSKAVIPFTTILLQQFICTICNYLFRQNNSSLQFIPSHLLHSHPQTLPLPSVSLPLLHYPQFNMPTLQLPTTLLFL